MHKISNIVVQRYTLFKELNLSEEEEKLFQSLTKCHICNKEVERGEIRVRDHCHLTNKFRGLSHQECNLNYKQKLTLPVFLHNFRGYDSHLIMQGFKNNGTNFRVIPSNTEKYISITVDNITFLDSLQFLPHSLDSLVESLKKDADKAFDIMHQCFSKEKCELLKRKGVYPYEYFDSTKKFTKCHLPEKKQFFSSVRNEHISDEDYEYAQKIFEFFEMKNLGDYHDLYLLTDSVLLACVFEKFRSLCLRYYELDPVYYLSAPGIAWDAALKMTEVELEQFTDIDMYLFMEKGIRGGISTITKRKVIANNKYMTSYDPNKPSSYILYLDMNNLYGVSLRDFLPVGSFRWLNNKEIEQLDLNEYDDNGRKGLALEVTLEYPQELHDEHNDYCLAVEKICIAEKNLSPYQKSLLTNCELKYNEKIPKLIPHLGTHKKYVVHYRNLKYYLEKGLILKKVHRALKFKQAAWLRKFIDFNTEKRRLSKSKVETDLFKLFNNSVFGKTMQNNRKQMIIKIVNTGEEAQRLIRRPEFQKYNVINDNLCTFVMQKRVVNLDRPIYCGFACLDLSKLFMYQFHYEKMKRWYGKKLGLLMTDTDSLCYEVETDDVYLDLAKHKKYFDFSEYKETHPLYSTENSFVVGKMKDEAKGEIIERFVGLGAKTYSMIGNNVFRRKAKGVVQKVKEKLLKHEKYERVIDYQSQYVYRAPTIRSSNHQLRTLAIVRTAIHGFDSKRYLRMCGIKSYAWGHYKIPLDSKQ
jgi:hypothetical protein